MTIHPAMATYAFSTRPLIQEPSNETANDVKQVCFADDSFAVGPLEGMKKLRKHLMAKESDFALTK